MKKLISITGLFLILTGCSAHVKLGYMLEADGESHYRNEELPDE